MQRSPVANAQCHSFEIIYWSVTLIDCILDVCLDCDPFPILFCERKTAHHSLCLFQHQPSLCPSIAR